MYLTLDDTGTYGFNVDEALKLKELKAKSEDSGSKARQYLEGLVRVPFGIFRREPILKKMENLNELFLNLQNVIDIKYIKKNK